MQSGQGFAVFWVNMFPSAQNGNKRGQCMNSEEITQLVVGIVGGIMAGMETRKPAEPTTYTPIRFEAFCEYWLEAHAKGKRSYSADEARVRLYLLPAFGDLMLMDVDYMRIKLLHRHIGEEKPQDSDEESKPFQANRVVEQLNVMFKHARLWGYYPKDRVLPSEGHARFPEPAYEGALENEDMPRLAESMKQIESIRMQRMLWLYLLTGLRCSELIKAEWSWYVKEKGLLKVPASAAKNMCAYDCELSPEARAIIDAIPRHAVLIFPGDIPGKTLNRSSVWRCWDRCRKRAKLGHIRLHGLRHTFATWIREEGFDLADIADLLNHKDLKSTRRYAHPNRKAKMKAVATLGQRLKKYIN